MAEDKNGFLLYADYVEIFDKLTDNEAGKLVKHLFGYVNDRNPILKNRTLEIVFEPIKQQLKRDLKNWESKKEKKSDSGQLGNLKRWHPDLFDQVVKGAIKIDDAQMVVNQRKLSQCDKNDRSAINAIAKIAVTVTDNVNVTGSGNAITDQPPPPPFSGEDSGRKNKLFEMFCSASMGMGYDPDYLKHEVNRFLNKYPGCIAAQSGGLANSWVANLNKQEQEKWKTNKQHGSISTGQLTERERQTLERLNQKA